MFGKLFKVISNLLQSFTQSRKKTQKTAQRKNDHFRICAKFGLVRSRLKSKVIAFVLNKSTKTISVALRIYTWKIKKSQNQENCAE